MPDCLEEAEELKERFPELPDSEVFDHVSYVCERTYYPDTLIGYAIMIAYERGAEAAYKFLHSTHSKEV